MNLRSFAKVLLTAVFLVTGTAAFAGPIPLGTSVSFNGSGTPLGSATWFNATGVATFGNDWVVTGSTGAAYAGTTGAAVTMQTFSWSPFAANNPVWSFTANGFTYTLTVNSATLQSTSNAPLPNSVVTGTGTLAIAGSTFSPTNGTFVFTAISGTPGVDLTFVSTAVPPPVQVPEPATLALIGIALAGLAFSRRRMRS